MIIMQNVNKYGILLNISASLDGTQRTNGAFPITTNIRMPLNEPKATKLQV